jgi:two-component system LytT family response regulator
MKIDAIIVDDEADNRSVLNNLLKMFCPQISVKGEAQNIEEAFDLISEHKPDVVFLDIQMPGGNGFSLLKKYKEIPFKVVFVTGYDKYALEAIQLSALHYLMKPVEVSDLLDAVKRIEQTIQNKNLQLQLENVEQNLEGSVKRIVIHENNQVFFLPLNDITHLEGDGKYTFIYTSNKKYSSSKNLGEFENMLEGNKQFFRIGKSCMVNLNFITNYSKGEPCMLTVSEKFIYEISRRKKQELLEKMKI